MKQTRGRKGKKRMQGTSVPQGMHKKEEPKDMVLNSRVRDSGSKVIFDNHTLCSQFLRDYVNLPYLKDVRPEDIEDVSEQYVTLFAEERNSDRVKRVHVDGGSTPFFLVSLIEHKTRTDYNVCMQIFRYMVYIWETYEKEAESIRKGMKKREDFLYPPILPIVYYEGTTEWNVPVDFKSRIREGSAFGKYLPDFEYYLVPLKDYSNEALMAKRDEISLVMLINKLQTAEDIGKFRELPGKEIEAILQNSPGHLVDTIADVLQAFLLKMNVPVSETERLTGKVREKKMGELFADMEKMDIQAERRNTANEKKRADEAQRRAEEAERRADEAEKWANEKDIKAFIEACQELGASREAARDKLIEKKGLSEAVSLEKMALYWKD
nr:Rpn family recombination-promoting nuclease/putative transposase [uncultured Acetatifactor sp.]